MTLNPLNLVEIVDEDLKRLTGSDRVVYAPAQLVALFRSNLDLTDDRRI